MQFEIDVKDSAVQQLRSALRGALVRPGDPDYEAARQVWNGAVNRHPALIAYCMGVADVLACVRLAREQNLCTAIRSGGQGVTGCARKSHAARGHSITASGVLGSTSTRYGYHRWVACAMRYRLQSSQAPLREGLRTANLAWALSIVQRMPERSLRSGITWRQAPSITPAAIGEPAARDTSSCLRGGGLSREPQRWAIHMKR